MSKRNRKAWRASVQRSAATIVEPREPLQETSQDAPHRLRGLARDAWIEQQVQEQYRLEVGDGIDMLIDSCKRTVAAFNSQMQAAHGEGKAWGPEVSPYENRMNGGLIARLLREKRTWLRECRQRLEQALDDEAAFEAEQAEAEHEPEAPRPAPAAADHSPSIPGYPVRQVAAAAPEYAHSP